MSGTTQDIMAENAWVEMDARSMLAKRNMDYIGASISDGTCQIPAGTTRHSRRRITLADGRVMDQIVYKNDSTGVMTQVDSVASSAYSLKTETGGALLYPDNFLPNIL
jgi:hypothetical protein